jgi:hypothetical protein
MASRGDLKAATDSSTRAIALFTEMRDLYDAALVKHNRGKLFRRMKERECAHKDFTEAMEAFRALGKAAEADAAAQDLQASEDRGGLPWWAWWVIVLFVLLCVLFVWGAYLESQSTPSPPPKVSKELSHRQSGQPPEGARPELEGTKPAPLPLRAFGRKAPHAQ